jgi:hypothetical protein
MWLPEQVLGMAWFKKKAKESRGNTATIEAKEAEIKRRAGELQMLAGKGGVPTGEAVTALAVALGNEIAVLVMRNPSLTVDEMADLVCQSVREAAHYTVSPSSDVTQEVGELTEPEFEQLTMRIINTAMPNATIRDAMSATAMALGYMIATEARRGAGFDDTLRWGQNAVIDCSREARDRLARNDKSTGSGLVE